MAMFTRQRQNRINYGRAWWWDDFEESTKEPVALRSPSQAIGVQELLGPSTRMETQVTASENHPSWSKRPKGRWSGDVGGPFSMSRSWVEFNRQNVLMMTRVSEVAGIVRKYTYAPIYPLNPLTASTHSFPSLTASSDQTLNAWGAKAIAECKPTNSSADLSTFLGEVLREGVPRLIGATLWKDKTQEALRKKASSEFLNYQFGWAPIARDIGKTASAIVSADSVLKQFQRDSGKLVRRRFEFPPEVSESVAVANPSATAYMGGRTLGGYFDSGNTGRLIRVDTTTTRRWFSGAFTYYVPGDGNVFSDMNRQVLMARKTLGLSLTPDVVWNLAPWSWAVDWFTNAGDVLSNMTDWAMYGLCLRYGYIMEHKLSRRTYTLVDGTGLNEEVTTFVPAPISFCRETKTRRKANPFGFGVTWNGLNPIQLAIAAALGISRFT